MRPIRTILALVVAAGTALGLAAPAAAQTASTPCGYLVCKIAIYTGVGNNKVEIPVPASGFPATPSAAPATITTSGWGTLHFDVASLDGPGYGSCMKECSHWWVEGNPTVIEVPSFLVGSQVAHGLNDVYTTVTWGHNRPASTGRKTWCSASATRKGACICSATRAPTPGRRRRSAPRCAPSDPWSLAILDHWYSSSTSLYWACLRW